MSYTIKLNTKVAVKAETVEGTYVAPAAGSDFLQALSDGLEMTPAREVIERDVLGLGLSKVKPRMGLKSVTGSIPVELKAGSTEGSEPNFGILMESLFGSKRSSAEITTLSGHSTTVIYVTSTTNLKVGDIVVIKQEDAYHVSPISAVAINESITLLVPLADPPSDNVKIAAFTTYVPADSGHKSFSVTKYVEDAVKEVAIGAKCTTLSIDNFSTGQVASLNFGFEGLDFDRSLEAPSVTPAYETSETPIILDACIFQNGTKISVNDFTLSIENVLGFIQDTCDGKIKSRVTERSVSGTINPYKLSNSVADFTRFNTNQPFSLFVTCHNPGAEANEFKESFSVYIPACVISEISEADADGILQENLSFSASVTSSAVKEVYISVS